MIIINETFIKLTFYVDIPKWVIMLCEVEGSDEKKLRRRRIVERYLANQNWSPNKDKAFMNRFLKLINLSLVVLQRH